MSLLKTMNSRPSKKPDFTVLFLAKTVCYLCATEANFGIF